MVITLDDGSVIEDRIDVADAHPLGARPYGRADYIGKCKTLADGIAEPAEQQRFLDHALGLGQLAPGKLTEITVEMPAEKRDPLKLMPGIFEQSTP